MRRGETSAATMMTLAKDAESKNGVANKVALVALGCPKNTVDAEVGGVVAVARPAAAVAAMLRAVISERPAPEELMVAAVHATFLRSRRVRSRTRRAPSRSGGGGRTPTILLLAQPPIQKPANSIA